MGKRGFDYDWPLPHPLYEALGPDADSRRQTYRRLVRATMKEADLKAIRDSLPKGWALGDDRFREEIARLSERALAVAAEVGGIALVIDAKDDKAARWYERFGVLSLMDHPLTLALSLSAIAEAIKWSAKK